MFFWILLNQHRIAEGEKAVAVINRLLISPHKQRHASFYKLLSIIKIDKTRA